MKSQSQAMLEGSGWRYSNVTWNDRSGAGAGDCNWVNYQNLDYDLDGYTDHVQGDQSGFNCYGDFDTCAPDFTNGVDWLQDVISGGAGTCAGSATNRSTEVDWVHYLWGLYAFGSDTVNVNSNELSVTQIIDLWVASDPANWDPTTLVTTPDTTDDPWPAWDAAAASAWSAQHNQQKDAVDH